MHGYTKSNTCTCISGVPLISSYHDNVIILNNINTTLHTYSALPGRGVISREPDGSCCYCIIASILITLVMLFMAAIPMIIIGISVGPQYLGYVVWPGPVIFVTWVAIIWQRWRAKNRTNPTVPQAQLPLPRHRLRAPRDWKTEQDRLLQLSVPRSVPGYSTEYKTMGTLNVKKATAASMHHGHNQENEKENGKSPNPMANVAQDMWWNKELSACVVKI